MDIKEKDQILAKSLYKMVKKQAFVNKKPKDAIQDLLDPDTEAEMDPNMVPVASSNVLNKTKKFEKSEDFAKDFLKSYVNVANGYKDLKKSSRYERFQEQKMSAPIAPREKIKQRQARQPKISSSRVTDIERSPVKDESYRGLKQAIRVGFKEAKDPETSYGENVKYKNQWLKDLLELNRRGQVKNLESVKPKEEDKQKDIKTTIMPMAASEKSSK